MTTRIGYLIKYTQTSSTDNSVIAFPQGDEGRIAGYDYAMRCYLEDLNLLSSTCYKMEAGRSEVFGRTGYPPLILVFYSSVH